jgi:hypothetical protein
MTRELNFRQSFSTQFETATSFNRTSYPDIGKLAPSDFPCFAITLGHTKYSVLDPLGQPTVGEQSFLLTVFFSVPEMSPETLLQYRSDYLNAVELFVSSSYAPPPAAPGETYRITHSQLVKINSPVLSKSMTRFSVTAECSYFFSIL